MGFSKLREWVGTVTGKGDRWEGDRLGGSEPAFLSANTIALHPPTCTARREAGQRRLRLLFCCEAGQLLAVCFFEACPGQIARRLCLPAVALFCRLCACSPLPCPLPFSCCPRSFCFAPLFIPCGPGSNQQVCKQHVCKLQDCPVGSNNAGLQWRPARRVVSTTPLPVLQGLPVGSRTMETAFGQPMRRCPLRHKRGRPRTACGQPAKFPTPAFREPETACEQPGSLLTFSLRRVHDPGPWV